MTKYLLTQLLMLLVCNHTSAVTELSFRSTRMLHRGKLGSSKALKSDHIVKLRLL